MQSRVLLRPVRGAPLWCRVGAFAAMISATGARADRLLDAPFVAVNAGESPSYLAAADLNADGKLDLVCASSYPGVIAVMLGIGGGTFGPSTTYAPTTGGSRPAIADFTGDGKLDIAVADSPNTSVAILPGLGDGTFGTPVNVEIGFQCYTVTAADLDHDGHVDLVASNWDKVAVRLGTGGGAFGPGASYQTATNTYQIAVGYLNADPYPDVVTAGEYGAKLSVLMGNGDGSLQAYLPLSVGAVKSLEVQDITGDGHDDIVAGEPNTLTVYAGDGSGGFSVRTDIDVPGASGRLHIADVNGDSKADVLLGSESAGSVSILFGDGTGGFPNRSQIATIHDARDVWIGDVDGDGLLDLLSAGGLGQIALHFGNGDGTFGVPRRHWGTGADPIAVGLGDLDGDGELDAVAAHHGSASISVRRGNGDGTFGIRRDYETGPSPPQALAVGDLDRDGHADVAVLAATGGLGNAYVKVLRGYASGSFGSSQTYAFGQQLSSVAIGDLNGDRAPDLVVTDAVANRLSVLINTGDGSFDAPVHYGAGGGAADVALGDLDGDGRLDGAVANPATGAVTLLYGDGLGAFVAEDDAQTGVGCRSVAIARVDADAILDVVTANGDEGTLSVLRGQGSRTFATAVSIPAGMSPASVAVARIDRDAIPDLVVGYGSDPYSYPYPYPPAETNLIGVMVGAGGGGFHAPQLFGTADSPQRFAIGDLDHNGDPDVVAACREADELVVLTNHHDSFVAVDPRPRVEALALGGIYPNPAPGNVAIPFAVPAETQCSLTIYDLSGRVVRTLVQGVLPAGEHLARWDRRADNGSRTGAGIYFFELRADGRKASGRLVLL